MFTLETTEFRNRSVLLVEDEQQVAGVLASAVGDQGGTVVGIAATIAGAIEIANSISVDVVLLHVRYAGEAKGDLVGMFKAVGAVVAFFAGFDDWFDPT